MSGRRNWDKVRRENVVRTKGAEPLNDLRTDSCIPPRIKRRKKKRKQPPARRSPIVAETQWRQCSFCPQTLLRSELDAHIKSCHPEYATNR